MMRMLQKYENRDSNLELLRIFSMLFVLILHFNAHALKFPAEEDVCYGAGLSVVFQIIIESLSIVAVNCFVLISGYFGIRFKIRGLVSLFMECLFYSVVIYSIFCLAGWNAFSMKEMLYSFLAFAKTPLWFISAYVGLYLLAPLVNRAIEGMSREKYMKVLIILTILNVYFGWIWKWEINPHGYGVSQMIYLYVLGRYLKLFGMEQVKQVSHVALKAFGGYVLGSLCLAVYFSFFLYWGYKSLYIRAFDYNNPLVLFSSVCLFVCFAKIKIGKKRWINWIASSALSVYIIHMNPYVWGKLRAYILLTAEDQEGTELIIWIGILVVTVFIGCIIIDKLRMLLMSPVDNKAVRLCQWLLDNNLPRSKRQTTTG